MQGYCPAQLRNCRRCRASIGLTLQFGGGYHLGHSIPSHPHSPSHSAWVRSTQMWGCCGRTSSAVPPMKTRATKNRANRAFSSLGDMVMYLAFRPYLWPSSAMEGYHRTHLHRVVLPSSHSSAVLSVSAPNSLFNLNGLPRFAASSRAIQLGCICSFPDSRNDTIE